VPHVSVVEEGEGRTLLVVTAHADDAALFAGGTIARWAQAGWRLVVIRATDDRWDSVGLSEEATVAANEREFARAMEILGVAEHRSWGLPTDTLGDASEVALRERVIRALREHRPYAVVSFDPFAMFGEDNQDHLKVAAAVAEAAWAAQFDKHHPEHAQDGLSPHGVFERWWFGRRVMEVTDAIDIAPTLERKIDAVLAHETPMRNLVHQLRLQARTGGYDLPALEEGTDHAGVIAELVRHAAAEAGRRHGLAYAEEFRVVRFGGLEGWLAEHGRPRTP
jgi:LmbE family N-acetylglucosaminyl deacetylase